MIEELFTVQQYRAALAERKATIEQLRQELATALHNATYMTAKVAEVDTERLALLDELGAARADNAVLCRALGAQLDPTRTIRERHKEVFGLLKTDHPGTALLAERLALLDELDTAQALIAGYRRALKEEDDAT